MDYAERKKERNRMHYALNADFKLRSTHIANALKGLRLRESTLLTYKITKDDFTPEQIEKLHPMVQNHIGISIEDHADPNRLKGDLPTPSMIFSLCLKKGLLSEETVRGYVIKSNVMRLLFKAKNWDDFYELWVTNTDELIQMVKDQYPIHYGTYLSVIVSLCKYDVGIEEYLETVIKSVKHAMNGGFEQSKARNIKKIANETIFDWDDILKMRDEIAVEQPFTQTHVLISLYTYIPVLRDNFGNVKIHYNQPIFLKDQEHYSYYVYTTGLFCLVDQKCYRMRGELKMIFPDELREIINQSLTDYRRQYLIQMDKVKLSGTIKKLFGVTINEMRHSYENWIWKHPDLNLQQQMLLNSQMGHDLDVGMTYLRLGDPSLN